MSNSCESHRQATCQGQLSFMWSFARWHLCCMLWSVVRTVPSLDSLYKIVDVLRCYVSGSSLPQSLYQARQQRTSHLKVLSFPGGLAPCRSWRLIICCSKSRSPIFCTRHDCGFSVAKFPRVKLRQSTDATEGARSTSGMSSPRKDRLFSCG